MSKYVVINRLSPTVLKGDPIRADCDVLKLFARTVLAEQGSKSPEQLAQQKASMWLNGIRFPLLPIQTQE